LHSENLTRFSRDAGGTRKMSGLVIDRQESPSVAVDGTNDRFPVRRIFCVGRNYAAHAREMGNDPDREPPFFFTKPADAVVDSGQTIPYPPLTRNLHHEIELVVAIASGGLRIAPGQALDHVWGYAVGVDLTRRDLQNVAKEAGRPWDWSKAFDRSAPCGPLIQVSRSGHPSSGRIWLAVNGEVKQIADLSEMIWPVADIVANCSEAMELRPGDLIFTGTPAGVGPLKSGDSVTGGIDGVGEIQITIGHAQ
jgi:fumarylpyruvate hydrolase